MPPPEPQIEILAKLLGMLEQVIFGGSTGNAAREFYTMPHPGVFVSPNLKETANSNDMALLSELFNQCYAAQLLYNPLLSSANQVYGDILQQAALPNKQLSADERRDLLRLEQQIERLLEMYLKYKDRHDAVLGEIYRARENGAPASEIAQLENKRRAALQEWEVRGKKRLYEETEAQISYYRSVSPREHFQNLARRYDLLTHPSPSMGSYQATYLSPSIAEWTSPYAGWELFEKKFKYSELHRRARHVAWSGSVGLNFGLFKKVTLGAQGERVEEYEHSIDNDIELKFEFLRVKIVRPWLIPDVFGYRFWTYKQAFGFRQVSDGYIPGTTPPTGPIGIMPVLPTNVVVARNVSISANFSESERTFVRESLSGGIEAGWGPFSARGSYRETTTTEDVVGTFDGTTLKIANPQIIAYMGTLLGKTPDPDRRLPWGPDADFGDPVPSPISVKSAATKKSHALQRKTTVSEIAASTTDVSKGIVSPDDYLKAAKASMNILRRLRGLEDL